MRVEPGDAAGRDSVPPPERLPVEVRRYFDAVARADADAVAECFAEDAVIIDVDRRIAGRPAIRDWVADEVIGGSYRVLEVTPRAGDLSVLLTFAPAGEEPFRARYDFELAGGKITRADLQYA